MAAANGTDTELQIDANNDTIFETVLTLSGTITGNIILTSEGGYTNNVIRIAPQGTGTPTSGSDFLLGTDGADTIDGLAGNDEMLGLGGADSLIGGEGNDSIDGGSGNDTVEGGLGQDTFSGAMATTRSPTPGQIRRTTTSMYGDAGDDSLQASSGQAFLYGGAGNDTLVASGTSYGQPLRRGRQRQPAGQLGLGLSDAGPTTIRWSRAALRVRRHTMGAGARWRGVTTRFRRQAWTRDRRRRPRRFEGRPTQLNGDRITDYTAGEKIYLLPEPRQCKPR